MPQTTQTQDAVEQPQDWYFTFGFNHAHPQGYVKINGTYNGAREEIVRRYGVKWAMQYSYEEFKHQPEKYDLKEVK